MIFRKTLCFLLAAVTAMSLSVFYAVAEEIYTTDSYEMTYHLDALSDWNFSGAENILAEHTDVESLKNAIFDCISETGNEVDIEDLEIPLEARNALSTYIYYCMPEAFNVKRLSYSYAGDYFLSIGFVYREFADTKEEYEECFSAMKASADSILDGIENNPALEDDVKALLLHDRLCMINEYKYQNADDIAHTAYGALVNHESVCQGYTMAYMYLLNRAGIKNYYCASDALNHAWNIVFIDSLPYHVDVTWDDMHWSRKDGGAAGAVNHNNFLRSTKGLQEEKHNAADFDSYPCDTKYDDYYWQRSNTEFQLIGNKLYYIDNENHLLKCADDDSVLADVSDVWKAGANSYWVGNYSCLSSAGGELLYSLTDGIYKYTVSSGESVKIYSPEMQEGFSVFCFTYNDDCLQLEINKAPPYGNTQELYCEKINYTDVSHVLYKLDADVTQAKTEYLKGDELDTAGVEIFACYTDGVREAVSNGISFSGFDSDSPGSKTVIAEYEGFSVSFTVYVRDVYFAGDADGDGAVTAADARLALRASVGLEKAVEGSDFYRAANIISDDGLTAADARLILRISVGLEDI